MEYLVFPFGKYKGVKLTELPSTYVVLALEKFDLPKELKDKLTMIAHARLGVHDLILKASDYGESKHEACENYYKLSSYAYDLVDILTIENHGKFARLNFNN
jgi:uncharacterized protein (DUF3820 family)